MSLFRSLKVSSIAVLAGCFSIPSLVFAQTDEILLELNKVESSQESCVLTFLASSRLPGDLEKLAYEFVIFDTDMRVDRMTVFDFRELKSGKHRVRQFQLSDTKCESLGRILINDTSACTGDSMDTSVCFSNLKISNKTSIEFLN